MLTTVRHAHLLFRKHLLILLKLDHTTWRMFDLQKSSSLMLSEVVGAKNPMVSSETRTGSGRGNPAGSWFQGFSDGWIMSLDVTAGGHLLLAWLTVESFC